MTIVTVYSKRAKNAMGQSAGYNIIAFKMNGKLYRSSLGIDYRKGLGDFLKSLKSTASVYIKSSAKTRNTFEEKDKKKINEYSYSGIRFTL